MLDPTQQRIVGVLIEKELAVPDSYPLTENSLLAGCNQKSNRDPEMSLEQFEVAGALLALRESGWVTRVDRGGRAARYRHCIEDQLGVDERQKPILAELLLRGPQAPGALKPRVARLGLHASADEVREILLTLAGAARPLVEELVRAPRERDRRWRHCLGEPASADAPQPDPRPSPEPAAAEIVPPPRVAAPDDVVAELTSRVERLEREVRELRAALGRDSQTGF